MTMLVFGRYGTAYPPDREILRVEADGAFTMWRSYGAPAVGRFSGMVPSLTMLREQGQAAAAVSPPSAGPLEPDESVETLALDGRDEVELPAGIRLEGPWGVLLGSCRALLDELTALPSAAVVASFAGPATLRLAHAGTHPLPAELDWLTVEVTRWHEASQAGHATVRPEGLGHVEAGPAWVLDVSLDPEVCQGPGQLVATASFVAADDGVYVPVVATARRGGSA
jgi:hypothetical protein